MNQLLLSKVPPQTRADWTAFIREISSPLRGYLHHRFFKSNPDFVEEAAQETLLAAYCTAACFKGGCPYATFVFIIARSKALQIIRRERYRKVATLDVDVVSSEESQLDLLIALVDRNWLDSQLAQLKPDELSAIKFYVAGMSYEEMSKKTGIPSNSLKSTVRRVGIRLHDSYTQANS